MTITQRPPATGRPLTRVTPASQVSEVSEVSDHGLLSWAATARERRV